MIIARLLMALLIIGNGWLGAEWHIGFTVSQRFAFPPLMHANPTRLTCFKDDLGYERRLHRPGTQNRTIDCLVWIAGLARWALRLGYAQQLELQLPYHGEYAP